MSGKLINSEQVKVYMKKRSEGKSQETAAAKVNISIRSGRRIEQGEFGGCQGSCHLVLNYTTCLNGCL